MVVVVDQRLLCSTSQQRMIEEIRQLHRRSISAS
jgi:hypothetical protein